MYAGYLCTNAVPFVVIIDEWDCIFRNINKIKEAQEIFRFSTGLIKDKACIYLSYMTGILPIKKYGTFGTEYVDEFSMIAPGP